MESRGSGFPEREASDVNQMRTQTVYLKYSRVIVDYKGETWKCAAEWLMMSSLPRREGLSQALGLCVIGGPGHS